LEGVIKSFNIIVSYDRSGLVLEYQTNVVLDLKKIGEIVWTEKGLTETRWYRASSSVLVSNPIGLLPLNSLEDL
jgi:hypothetical protein